MSKSEAAHYTVLNPRPEHFHEIQELCKKVYPFSKPWSIEQLESHRSYFPDGQLIAIDTNTGEVVGLAFSLIISWEDYSPQDSWTDFTSGGFFYNHNPKKGKTLYGAEVMVDPEVRGKGIGKILYQGRQEIASKYGIKRIRAGARLRGYSKFKDKLTPHEYVVQVVQKKIFDPTLSFQLNRDFVVLDVAKNYLFNDPESLGYAAVIEWLNPQFASPRAIKRQSEAVEAFLSLEKMVPEYLPRELRRLVRRSTYTLGTVLREVEGIQFYNLVESLRVRVKKMRVRTSQQLLESIMSDLKSLPQEVQLKVAHAFALQLEVVNVCEAAYRTWRQMQKPTPQNLKQRLDLKFVLTAHPTEARSRVMVEQLQKLLDILIKSMQSHFAVSEQELLSQVRLLWHLPLAKKKIPSVLDEAEFIFSTVFSDHVFDFFITEKPSYDIKLRTWVGGDKDGHPGVTSDVMKGCLTLSRRRIIKLIQEKLYSAYKELILVDGSNYKRGQGPDSLKMFARQLDPLLNLSSGDGTRVKKWILHFDKFVKSAHPLVSGHFHIQLVKRTIEVFPGLVMPIELREDASVIKDALTNKEQPIRRMLSELAKISGAMSFNSYARGLVISHCENELDMTNAVQLIQQAAKSTRVPIVPLFESKSALVGSKKIIKKWMSVKKHVELVKRQWGGVFEVMLGYSDSSKEIGVFPSRTLIRKSMFDLESYFKSQKIKPVFFHGSGGSVARGGGSLKEQIAWWPSGAIERPKMTIQGEMIQRFFASKEIMNSQCSHLANEALKRKAVKLKFHPEPAIDDFASRVEGAYSNLVGDSAALNSLLEASPFRYLEMLRLGSRPSKRMPNEFSLKSLRAIPWILCWTQTRSLWPTWFGTGSAWVSLNAEEKARLIGEFNKNPFFSSFVKSLGFTLAKVDLKVWRFYFQQNEGVLKRIEAELKLARAFVGEVSQKENLIWYRPWLEESIRFRAPHVHVLNLLQVIAMERNDEFLLKETLVGIACGMLTTG